MRQRAAGADTTLVKEVIELVDTVRGNHCITESANASCMQNKDGEISLTEYLSFMPYFLRLHKMVAQSNPLTA